MVTFPETLAVQNLNLQKGETLFKQGDAVRRIFLVDKGKVKLVRNTIDGTPVVLHVVYQGKASPRLRYYLNSIIALRKPSLQVPCRALANKPC